MQQLLVSRQQDNTLVANYRRLLLNIGLISHPYHRPRKASSLRLNCSQILQFKWEPLHTCFPPGLNLCCKTRGQIMWQQLKPSLSEEKLTATYLAKATHVHSSSHRGTIIMISGSKRGYLKKQATVILAWGRKKAIVKSKRHTLTLVLKCHHYQAGVKRAMHSFNTALVTQHPLWHANMAFLVEPCFLRSNNTVSFLALFSHTTVGKEG